MQLSSGAFASETHAHPWSARPRLCSWLTVLKRLAFGRNGAGGISNVGMGLFDEEPFASMPGTS